MTSMDDIPVGQLSSMVTGHIEDNDVCAWCFNTGDGRLIYAGEISNASFAELDPIEQHALGGKPFGWFLMCFWRDRHEVWGKCAGSEQARQLVTMIGSMIYAGVLWRQEDVAGARRAAGLTDGMRAPTLLAACRQWLDADNPSHWGSFERDLDRLVKRHASR